MITWFVQKTMIIVATDDYDVVLWIGSETRSQNAHIGLFVSCSLIPHSLGQILPNMYRLTASAMCSSCSMSHFMCSMSQCVAVCCSVLQCGAVWCSVLQCGAVSCRVFSVLKLQCVALYVQYVQVAVCRNLNIVCSSCSTLRHTAI